MHGPETAMAAQTCEQAVGVGLSIEPSLPAASEEVAAPVMEADARLCAVYTVLLRLYSNCVCRVRLCGLYVRSRSTRSRSMGRMRRSLRRHVSRQLEQGFAVNLLCRLHLFRRRVYRQRPRRVRQGRVWLLGFVYCQQVDPSEKVAVGSMGVAYSVQGDWLHTVRPTGAGV